MRFSIYQQSLVGARRNNQDRVAYSYSKDALLLAVADGMGGHIKGEVAAEIVVSLLVERFQRHARTTIKNPYEFLSETLHAAHQAIFEYAEVNGLSESPRTTIVASVIQNSKAYWAHVGDSRLYFFRDGNLVARTNDHSRVQQMLDAGLITQQQAMKHPERNRIYNCLGGPQLPLVWLANPVPVAVGDTIMLSSDGFWAHLQEEEIIDSIARQSIVDALPGLMQVAEKRGGKKADNLTVVAITWENDAATEAANGKQITTDAMVQNIFTTEMGASLTDKQSQYDDVTEEEIDKAIAEIQNTIKKYSR
ncbi:MAG: protein phosphatase 2C domain-containing protein [Burkholderiales bacterium]